MLSNYLKITIRNLFRHKTFSLINITGLAVGITCFLVLSLYVVDEVGHDRFYKDSDRIYRIYVHSFIAGEESNNSKTSAPMGETLKRDYPEVETFTFSLVYPDMIVEIGMVPVDTGIRYSEHDRRTPLRNIPALNIYQT